MLPRTKEDRKQELDKLKHMDNWSQRLSYIWSYYHIVILIGIVAIFTLSWFASILYRQTQETMLYVVSINQPHVTGESIKPIEEEFRILQKFDKKKQVLSFDTGMDYSDMSYATATEIKLQSFYATQTLDVIITTEDFLDAYDDKNIFIDISTILDDAMLDKLSPYFVYGTTSTGETIPIGISLDHSVLADKVDLKEGSVLSVSSMEENGDVVVAFIGYCFGVLGEE